MADYPPPTQTLPDFNPAVFRTNDTPLTITEAENYFVTFPTAQGTTNNSTINVATVNVSSDLTLTNSSTFGTIYGYQSTKPTSGTSIHNTAFGYQSGVGLVNTTGTGGNTAFGAITFADITGVAENNTAVGHNALRRVSTGDGNTQVGMTTNALALNLTTGNNNTLIGREASVSGTGISTSTAIGYLAQATASNQIVLGTASETTRYQLVSPLYTTVPTYTTANIGYRVNIALTFDGTSKTDGAMVADSDTISFPQGVWLVCICASLTGTWVSGNLHFRYAYDGSTSTATQFYFPIVASAGTGTGQNQTMICSGSGVWSGTTLGRVILQYNSSSTATNYNVLSASHTLQMVRLA